MKLDKLPLLTDIQTAHERIKPYIHHTPVLSSQQLNERVGASVFFKCENFQKAGAFKTRGAMNAILSLSPEELSKGVATHSSGNHAQALARAAMILKVPAFIVMPENAPKVKVAAVEQYGGKITFCPPTLEAREGTLRRIIEKTGATLIHPYNDYSIIAGQATAGLELISECNGLDIILCPVGGGGLLSGTLLSALYLSPDTKVIACEPEGANDAWQSFKSGKLVPSVNPQTISDGLLTSLGSLTWPTIRDHVFDIITVTDNQIIEAMKLVWERMKIIIEPSSAVPVAVALSSKKIMEDRKVGIILSGGNIDLNKIPWL
jgi:threonine dehydratase